MSPSASMGATEWVASVHEKRVQVGSTDGAIAMAVLDLLHQYLLVDGLRGPWEDHPNGRKAAVEILSGLRYPKAAEAASLLSCPETAASLGFLIAQRLKWLGGLNVSSRPSQGLTRLDSEAVGMTDTAREYGIPLPKSARETPQQHEAGFTTAGERSQLPSEAGHKIALQEDNPPRKPTAPYRSAPAILTQLTRVNSTGVTYETRPEVAAPMTIREMVRQVMRRGRGKALSNAQIREQVHCSFEAGLSDRQIDQAIVGLRRDGELRRVARAHHVATKRLGHDPIPTDPTRRRARP